MTERPLQAHVAKHNAGSIRVPESDACRFMSGQIRLVRDHRSYQDSLYTKQ